MNRIGRRILAAILLLGIRLPFLYAQQGNTKNHAIPMPADRVRDSYRVYSALMPIGETAGNGWPHKLWLIKNTTETVIPKDKRCTPVPGFEYPLPQNEDFLEVLKDFNSHCHDRIALDTDVW